MIRFVNVSLCLIFFISVGFTQKGFHLGVGSGLMILNDNNIVSPKEAELNEFSIKGSNPLYFEVKLDYGLSTNLTIKSGMQWRWRQMRYSDFNNEIKTLISVPIIVSYRLPINFKNEWAFRVNGGYSVDNFISNSSSKSSLISTENTAIIIESSDYTYNGSFLSFNGSYRVGFEIEKDLGSLGRLGLQVMYSKQNGGIASINTDIRKEVYKVDMPDQLDYRLREQIEFNEKQSGFLIGINYYFGQFHGNRK